MTQRPAAVTTERSIAMPLGVVIERRAIDHPWQKWRWRPVAVLPGAGPVAEWKELERDDAAVRWHAATLTLELHRKETLAYRENLSSGTPSVYVVLRAIDGAPADRSMAPFRVTASPYEAQDYLDAGEDIIERVAMPPGLVAWVQAFIDRHHVDETFRKRQRQRYEPSEAGFGRRPDHPDLGRRKRIVT